jgi:hypothetical protein
VNKKPLLVNEEELRTLIDGLDLKDKQRNEYLKARRWNSRAEGERWKQSALRSAMVIAEALIPALIGLRELDVLSRND